MATRRFTERETGEVLRKAAEIQFVRASATASGGVSEEELRAAARELGIDAKAVDEALGALDEPSRRPQGLIGGPFEQEAEYVVDGSLSDDQWEETLADLRRTFKEEGKVSQRGDTREWSGWGNGLDLTTVTLRQVGHSVRVSVTSRMGSLAFVLYFLAVFPAMIGSLALARILGWPDALPAVLAWVALVFGVARSQVVRASKSRTKSLAALAARMRRRLEEPSAAELPESIQTAVQNPDELPERTTTA